MIYKNIFINLIYNKNYFQITTSAYSSKEIFSKLKNPGGLKFLEFTIK